MTAVEGILGRRSIRKYKDEKVSHELIKEIVDIARFAPSWANLQVAKYTIVDSPDLIAKISEGGVNGFSYNMNTLKNAKGVAVLSYTKGKSGLLEGKAADSTDPAKKGFWEAFDSGIACQTFCLAAHAKGVGTCIFGVINSDVIAKIVNLPDEETVAALIVYGFADEQPEARPRHAVEDVVRFT